MAVDIDDKKLDGKGLGDLWGIIKQYVAQHGSGVVPATEDTLGGIMVGSTLSITNAGVLNLPTLVTASTFRSVSVDAYGRVVGGTNPTTLAAYGITDAKIENGVITLGGNTITPITSLSGYATQSWVQQQGYTTNIGTVTQVKIGSTAYNPSSGVVSLPSYPTVPTKVSELTNDSGYTTNIGTVTQVKVGSTAYNPSSGVVSLPAYPTSLPASDVYSWAKASSKPSYTLDEVSDGSSRKLANYLQLSGGTVTGAVTFNYSSGSELTIKNTDGKFNVIRFVSSAGVNKGAIHYFYSNSPASNEINVTSSNGGLVTLGDWQYPTLVATHSGNNQYDGNVGIRTRTPAYALDVNGSAAFSGNVNANCITFDSTGTSSSANTGGIRMGRFDESLGSMKIQFGTSGRIQIVNDAWSAALFYFKNDGTFTTSGSVGVGTDSPSYKLHVNGSLYASTYYNLPFSVQRGTMNHTVANGSHLYYLSMSVDNARKCVFSYIMHNAYQYQSGCYSCHAGNGLADTMGVKYVTDDTYNGTRITNSWIVTTGGFDAGYVYYNYVLIA